MSHAELGAHFSDIDACLAATALPTFAVSNRWKVLAELRTPVYMPTPKEHPDDEQEWIKLSLLTGFRC